MANIFVVEDSKSQAALLRHILSDAGHDISLFENGKLALDALTTNTRPDLVLSDIAMPVMDGLALCNAIKTDPNLQNIPTVLITASEKIDELVNGLNAMAEGYLIKPYNHKVLIDTVDLLLRQKADGTLPSPKPEKAINVTIGHQSFALKAGREHLFEFFMIAFNNAAVQTRELDERERKLRQTNIAFARNIELLSASEERFRSLVEAVPDIVYRIDSTGCFTFVNDAIINLGYEPSELVGQHFSTIMSPEAVETCSSEHVLESFSPGKKASQPKLFDEKRTKDRMTIGLRIRLLTKGRATIISELQSLTTATVNVEVNSMGIYGVDGHSERKYVGTVGVIRDITERMSFEKELEIARDAAISANRSKSEFLSSMSHELRTPLNAVLGFSNLLDMPENPLNNEQKEMVGFINEGGELLLRLIDDVLDLAKIESGNDQMDIQSISKVNELINSAISMITVTAAKRNIEVFNKTEPELPSLKADPIRLQQVLVNLFSNAVKYNNDQGTITVSTESHESFLRICITDTGIGIPENKMSDLFKPFQRLGMENGTIEGTGIGLTITKRLVENMSGNIGVESELGKGSTFWVELLLDEKSSPAAEKEKIADNNADSFPEHSLHVLYIEDNPMNSLLMQRVLKRYDNITLHISTCAEDGIQYVQQQHPDVILMDIRLPGMSGIEATLLLKSDAATSDIPIIAVTADAMPEISMQANSAGFFGYLTKPVNFQELISLLARIK